MSRGFGYWLALILVCAFIGSAAGEIIARLLPPESHSYQFFASGIGPSLSPFEIDLILLKITFGLSVRLNLTALLAMVAALVHLARRL